MKKKLGGLFTFSLLITNRSRAQSFGAGRPKNGGFPLVTAQNPVSIYVDNNDEWLIHKAAASLHSDIETVTARKPAIMTLAHSN